MSEPPKDLEPEEERIYALWSEVRRQVEPWLPQLVDRVVGQAKELEQDPRFESPGLWQVISGGLVQLLNMFSRGARQDEDITPKSNGEQDDQGAAGDDP